MRCAASEAIVVGSLGRRYSVKWRTESEDPLPLLSLCRPLSEQLEDPLEKKLEPKRHSTHSFITKIYASFVIICTRNVSIFQEDCAWKPGTRIGFFLSFGGNLVFFLFLEVLGGKFRRRFWEGNHHGNPPP
jgi:hypothetical protein